MATELIGRSNELDAALLAIASGDGVLLSGEAGIGKSCLLDECARAFGRDPESLVVTLRASATTSSISLWPFHHLLPQSPSEDLANLSNHIRRHFQSEGETRTLIVVDEAEHLDPASVGMIEYLLALRHVALLAAVRSGTPGADVMRRVGLRFDVERIDLEPLAESHCEQVVENLLAGPVDSATATQLSDASRGNPLLLRELVLDAVENTTLDASETGWRLRHGERGVLDSIGDRTRLCVRRRLDRLDDDGRRLVDVLAVAGPIRPDLLSPRLAERMEDLEARRLITVAADRPGAWTVRLDHPLVGEVVNAAMTGTTRLAVLAMLIERQRAVGSRAVGDDTRMAYWAEEAGGKLGEHEWLAAVDEALAAYDFEVAERWGRQALEESPDSHAANLALGRVLRHRRRHREAAAAFQAAQDAAVNDTELAATAIEHAALVALPLGDPRAAVTMLSDTAERVSDPDAAACLRSEAAMFATLLGEFDSDTLVPDEVTSAVRNDSTRWLVGLNELYARTMLGRLSSLDELVATTLRVYPAIAGQRPQEFDFVVGLRGAARLQRGELTRGIDELSEIVEERRESGRYRGISAVVLAVLLTVSADGRARREAADAVDQHEWMDPLGTAPIAVSVASLVEAMCGDVEAADALARRGEAIGSEPWSSIWAGRARARVHHLRGDDAAAVDACVAAAEVAVDTSHAAYAAVTAHDLVAYGDARSAARLLDAAVDGTDGCHLLQLMRAHAHAVERGDSSTLRTSAAGFSDIGAPLLATEAFFDWAEAAGRNGDSATARLAVFLGQVTSRHVAEGYVIPAAPDVADRLSSREADVAVGAVAGLRSRQIAEKLDLSTRTVDNHLRNVYRKLRLSGREHLRDAVFGHGSSAPTGTTPAALVDTTGPT